MIGRAILDVCDAILDVCDAILDVCDAVKKEACHTVSKSHDLYNFETIRISHTFRLILFANAFAFTVFQASSDVVDCFTIVEFWKEHWGKNSPNAPSNMP
ncbi:hypothetical protein BsWGS_09565 [Bradybaena similaris]